jgi:hypothetical protein
MWSVPTSTVQIGGFLMDDVTKDLWLAHVAESHRLKEAAVQQRSICRKLYARRVNLLVERDGFNTKVRCARARLREMVLAEVDIAEKRAQFGSGFLQYVEVRVDVEVRTSEQIQGWLGEMERLSAEITRTARLASRADALAHDWGNWAAEWHLKAEALYGSN